MRRPRSWGVFLLAIWLILSGALTFIQLNIAYKGELLAAFAIVVGVLLLLDR